MEKIDLSKYEEITQEEFRKLNISECAGWIKENNKVRYFKLKPKTPIQIQCKDGYYLIYQTGNVEKITFSGKFVKNDEVNWNCKIKEKVTFIPKEDIIKLYEEIKKL